MNTSTLEQNTALFILCVNYFKHLLWYVFNTPQNLKHYPYRVVNSFKTSKFMWVWFVKKNKRLVPVFVVQLLGNNVKNVMDKCLSLILAVHLKWVLWFKYRCLQMNFTRRHAICWYYHGLCANFQDIGFLIEIDFSLPAKNTLKIHSFICTHH